MIEIRLHLILEALNGPFLERLKSLVNQHTVPCHLVHCILGVSRSYTNLKKTLGIRLPAVNWGQKHGEFYPGVSSGLPEKIFSKRRKRLHEERFRPG